MNKTLKKIALVTGSATRIGARIATYLAKKKWSIILHYNHSQNEAEKLAKELSKITEIFLVKSDLSDEKDYGILIKHINDNFGIIDLLINNAAHFLNDNIANLNKDSLDQHLQINLIAPLMLCKDFQQQYSGTNGNIVNILDNTINQTSTDFLSYNISKNALAFATKSLSLSMAPHIRVNAICPGPTIINQNQSQKHFDNLCKNTPLGYSGKISDICNTIDFILKNRSITGQMIFLDGGSHLKNN